MPKLYKKHYLNEQAWEAAKEVYDQLHEPIIIDHEPLAAAIYAFEASLIKQGLMK